MLTKLKGVKNKMLGLSKRRRSRVHAVVQKSSGQVVALPQIKVDKPILTQRDVDGAEKGGRPKGALGVKVAGGGGKDKKGGAELH